MVRRADLSAASRKSLFGCLPKTFGNMMSRAGMTLQGKGIEADTTPRRLEISWDGQWADETKQMVHHFVIKEV
jgi:hypothetical protein